MEPSPKQTRVIPESALLHFAFTQRQYVAVLNAVQYFARKLQDPNQRELAMSALAVLQAPSGFSLPSEASDDVAPADAPARGIESLREGKK